MKLTQILLVPALALGLTTAAMAQQTSSYDAQLTLSPVTGTTTLGVNTLTYNINVSQLQGNPNAPQALGAYDLFIDFNPSVLSVVGTTFGTKLQVDSEGDSTYTSSTSGQFELSDVSLDSNSTEPHQGLGDFYTQAKSFTIGTITFAGVTAGTSTLTFDATSSLSDQNGNTIVFGAAGSSLTVAAPEPSSIGLAALALVGFAGLAIRRRLTA